MLSDQICNHCGYALEWRMMDKKCDHLYYPDNCKICKAKDPKDRCHHVDKAPDFLEEEEMEI